MSRILTNVSQIGVPSMETLKIEGTGSLKVPTGNNTNDGRYIRTSTTSLTFPGVVNARPADTITVSGTAYAPWYVIGAPIFIYSAASPTVWAEGSIVSYSHPNLEILFDNWISDAVFHNDWQIGSHLEMGSVRYNQTTSSLDLVVPVATNAEATIRTSDGSYATYLKLSATSGTFALPGDLILNGQEISYNTNQAIDATHNKKIVKLDSVGISRTFTVAAAGTLGAKFYAVLLNKNTGALVVNGTFEDGTTTLTLQKGQSVLIASDGATNKILFRSSGQVQTIQQGNNITVDSADPFNPIVHATIPLLVQGHGIVVDNSDVHNPVVSAKDFFIIPCSDEISVISTGDGKVTFRTPYAFALTGLRASLNVAQTGGSLFTIDIKRWNGTSFVSILSTLITFDNGERTTTTALTQPVASYTNLLDDEELRIDVTQVGDGTAKGLKVTLLGA